MSRHTLCTTLKQYGLDERGRPVEAREPDRAQPGSAGTAFNPAAAGVASVALSAVLGLLWRL